MTGTPPVHWESQFVHLNILIKAGAIIEKQIYMVLGGVFVFLKRWRYQSLTYEVHLYQFGG